MSGSMNQESTAFRPGSFNPSFRSLHTDADYREACAAYVNRWKL